MKCRRVMIVKFEGIDWDVSDEGERDCNIELPHEVFLEFEDDDEFAKEDDYVIDQLSEEYGWLVNGVESIRRFKEI